MQKKPRYSSIEEYIAGFAPHVQDKLRQLQRLVRELAPEAEERISYQMPAFYLNGNLVYFAAHTSHIGFYPTSSGVAKFENELRPYVHSKGSVQFPIGKPLPLELIRQIVLFRVDENRKKGRRGRRKGR